MRYRAAAQSFTRVERWEPAGDIDLKILKGAGKSALLTSVTNCFRHQAMDARKASQLVSRLSDLDIQKDVYVLKGIKKQVYLDCLHSEKYLFGCSDLTITQSNVEFYRPADKSNPVVLQIIEVHSKTESSLLNFVSDIELMDHWQICSMSEFMITFEENNDQKKPMF